MARHNNIKIYNTFYRKNYMFYLPLFQSTFDDILLSRYYIARGGTNTNYAKKVVIFIIMHTFSYGKLDKIKRLHKIHTLCASIFFFFGHRIET